MQERELNVNVVRALSVKGSEIVGALGRSRFVLRMREKDTCLPVVRSLNAR